MQKQKLVHSIVIVAYVLLGLLFIAVLATAAYFPEYRRKRAVRGEEYASCIKDHVGYDVSSGNDWAWYADTLTTRQIQDKVGLDSPHPENVINNCLGRPIK